MSRYFTKPNLAWPEHSSTQEESIQDISDRTILSMAARGCFSVGRHPLVRTLPQLQVSIKSSRQRSTLPRSLHRGHRLEIYAWLWQCDTLPGHHVVNHYALVSDLRLAYLLDIPPGYLLLCFHFSVLSSFAIGWEEYLTGVSA